MGCQAHEGFAAFRPEKQKEKKEATWRKQEKLQIEDGFEDIEEFF